MTHDMITQVTCDFDSSNSNWMHNPDYNRIFIRAQESYVNDILIVNGFVTLNELLSMLGIAQTAQGLTSGWVASHGRINIGVEEVGDKLVLTLNVQDNIQNLI